MKHTSHWAVFGFWRVWWLGAGAGACALPMAIHHHFPKAVIDAVDHDAEALDLAHCFFDAKEDAHLMLHHEDGLKFLTKHGVASQVWHTHPRQAQVNR